MGKKILFACLLAVVLLAGSIPVIYALSPSITQKQIQSPNTKENRQSIAETLLKDTGRRAVFSPDEISNITVYQGNVYGDEKNEVVIAAEVSPKVTLVAVYTPTTGGFSYVGDVGEFYTVENIQFLPIESEDNDLIIVQEKSNQNVGAYEDTTFYRIYRWDGKEYVEVLRLPENINATWNYAWDDTTGKAENNWQRVAQSTETTYTDSAKTELNLIHQQEHLISSDKVSKTMPKDDTFNKVNERIVTERYFWNNDWKRFILGEAKDKATGETVAIIDDFGASPYALLEDFKPYVDNVRIQRKDGTTDIVKKDTLENITSTPENQQALETFYFQYP